MVYNNNFPKMYIFTKCLQIKCKKEIKVQKRVNEDQQSPPVKEDKMYNERKQHTSYS